MCGGGVVARTGTGHACMANRAAAAAAAAPGRKSNAARGGVERCGAVRSLRKQRQRHTAAGVCGLSAEFAERRDSMCRGVTNMLHSTHK